MIEATAKSRSTADLLTMFDNGRRKGFLTRLCCYYFIAAENKSNLIYPSIEHLCSKVLSTEVVRSSIQATLRDEDDASDKHLENSKMVKSLESKAAAFASEMIGTVTSRVIRFCGWIYLSLLKQVCTSVQFSPAQIQMIQEVAHGNVPVVYMPLHLSHVDYILVSLILFHNNIRAPYIASGDNLHLPLFGYFIKRAGGFFIRRKIDESKRKDLIYRAVLQGYIMELLKDGQSIEIFLEGTRSRSGMPNYPKTGLLSLLVDAVVEGQIEDAMLVPVSISYERLFEGNFNDELMGKPKVKERLFSVLASIFRMFCGNYGAMKINFGKPKSLRNALDDVCKFSSCKNLTLDSPPSPPGLNSNNNVRQVVRKNSDDSFQSSHQDVEWRKNISLLAEHVVYGGLECRSFMATNLVAYLLVNRWRYGVYLPDLVASFTILKKEIISRGRDVAFCGEDHDVVVHAINLLGAKVITLDYVAGQAKICKMSRSCESLGSGDASITMNDLRHPVGDRADSGIYLDCDNENEQEITKEGSPRRRRPKDDKPTLFVAPVLDVPSMFELAYYSNSLTPLFSLESIVCLSVTALTGFRFTTVQEMWNYSGGKGIFEDSLPEKMCMSFLRSALIDKALELTDFLQMDLILCDVTSDLEDCIKDTVHSLISSGCLCGDSVGSNKQTHIAYGLDEEENFSEDQWLKVDTSSINKLTCYQSVLAPVVESLAIVTEQLKHLSDPVPQSHFMKLLLERSQDRVKDGLATRVESCSKETLSHCIYAFKTNKVIEFDNGSLKLSHEFNSPPNLDHLLNKICQYLM